MKKIVFFLFGICLMGTITLAQSTVTDFDGNIYQTIVIGNQVWMAENLNSTHYADGTPIPLVEDSTTWVNLTYTDKAYCYYDNNISNGDVYGALYTWPAAMNGEASSDNNPSGVQGVCPDGWHLPGDTEWKQLEMYLGMSQADADNTGWRGTDEGGKLKETDTTHWYSPNTGATNESGFSALPGGYCDYDGPYVNMGYFAYFWSSTENSSANAWGRGLPYSTSEVGRNSHSKDYGFSVRCVKTHSLYTDSLALVALYDSTDGTNWTNDSNWLTGNVADWYGIIVSGDRVTRIKLDNNNLTGPLPTAIGDLTNLEELTCEWNQISGLIPHKLWNLTNLIILKLSDNLLFGTLPPEIGNLINLETLIIYTNNFSGAIPLEIQNLTTLSWVWIQGNKFTDLPDLSSLTSLADLEIQNNKFTFEDIEPNIGVPTSTFEYSPQDSVGEIIDATAYIGTNYTLSVSTGGANSLYQWKKDGVSIGSISSDSTYTINPVAFSDSGTYTCEITNMVATELTLYSRPVNVFVDYTPLQKDSLALVALYNSTDGDNWTDKSNWLTGNVADWYGITVSSDRVTQINLNTNNLTGPIPPEIGNLSNLQGLILHGNQLSGAIPNEIGNLSALGALGLDGNQLSGSIPSEIWTLIQLTYLDLSGNQFTGSIPPEIGNLINLEILAVSGIQLTGPIPPEIGNLTNLQELYLNSNQLTGSIPIEIGNLTNLQYLSFGNNQLTGLVSSVIGDLINLENLQLNNNQFSGSIPVEISNLINLNNLWLQCNQLSGTVPVEIWNLSSMGNLQLFDNQLSGTIPPEIGNMSNLVFLNLQNNQFTGLANLSLLGSLDELTIENNRFTFEDIEPNIDVASTTFTYSPQDSVGEIIYTTVYAEANLTLSVSTGGANSLYQWKKDGTNIGDISADSTCTIISFTSSDLGAYTCEIINTVATDLTLYSRPIHVTITGGPIISSFPYSEDFESGNDGWYTGGANTSWQLGNPAGITINSATYGFAAWVTNLTGDYNPDEISYVISPRFNLSGIEHPKIEFSIWWYAEGFYDGANFQYKQGTGIWKTLGTDQGDDSWYNSSYIYSIEKGFGFDLDNSAGWSGDNEWGYGSNGWVTVSHALTGIDNLSDVTFRIAFASNSGYQNDGVAIDDINIFDDPTGINPAKTLLSDIQIYPNPNEGKFRLVYNGERDVDLKLQLINLQGQVILSEQIKTGYRFSKEFELDYLPPGIYYFKLMHKEGVVVKKMAVR